MMTIRKAVFSLGFLTVLLLNFAAQAQYVTNGSASQNSCNCYTLTQQVNTQSGSVWNSNKIDLTNSFDFHFNVYLGCQDANGADGIVFILQPISTVVGTTGSGMGFQGVSPSVGIALDTYQNPSPVNDPVYDHISIQTNGYVNHDGNPNNLVQPVPISSTSDNVEDCQWHVLRITWNAVTKTITAYFDGVQRVQATYDLVANIFSGNPSVYWGFTGATGGSTNLQQFCTALNPQFTSNFSGNATCFGTPMLFQDNSESFTTIQTYYWDFGDNTTSTLANPPAHLYAAPGPYIVKHVISGADGCVSDTMKKTIQIGAIPVASFSVFDTCFNKPVRLINNSSCAYGALTFWEWTLDGAVISNAQTPVLPALAVGAHTLQLRVQSEYGCGAVSALQTFTIKANPQISFTAADGCVNSPVQFTGTQVGAVTVSQWNWNFGDGNTSTQQNPAHTYTAPQQPYTGSVYAIAANGCSSDTLRPLVNIGATPVPAFEVRDTCEGKTPYFINQTTITGGTIAQWNWLLNNQPFSTLSNPDLSGLPAGNYQLQLTAAGNTGCTAAPVIHSFVIRSVPVITATGTGGCFGVPAGFTATQTDNQSTIAQWAWSFGDGGSSSLQNPSHTYTAGGTYNATVIATASNGCATTAVPVTVNINKLSVFAGNDTTVIQNVPFLLKPVVSTTVNNTLIYQWSPVTGLSSATILQPTSTLSGVDSIIYTLTVTSADGCTASDQVKIKVFNGVAIYVPKGFTPDGNGRNDILRPVYAGITGLNYFAIYNRWGQLVFRTSNMGEGWDGTINGIKQSTGVFVWIIRAVDYTGKTVQLRGTTTLIR